MNKIEENQKMENENISDGRTIICHLDLAFEMIRGKWKAVILCHLNEGPKRFLELQRITCGVSQKVLNEKLRELEDDGLIFKTVFPEVPPKVVFELTEIGKELYPAIKMIEEWAVQNFPCEKS